MESALTTLPAIAADQNAPAPGWTPDERRFKVFISYARGDSADFAQQVLKA
jgi:hypothetical protein